MTDQEQSELPLYAPSLLTLQWDPQPDITTHELAIALGLLMPATWRLPVEEFLLRLPPQVRRHFKFQYNKV